jgi:lipopolysaccharide export system permease protein
MERPERELTVVAFDAYGFDLTDLAAGPVTTRFRPSERTLFELLAPSPDDGRSAEREARFQIELHDRLSQPIAPFVYALVVFLFVGDPRMHRQSRFAGIVMAALSVAAIRGATYAILLASEDAPALALLVYPALVGTGALAVVLIATDRTLTFHERAASRLVGALQRLAPRPMARAAVR